MQLQNIQDHPFDTKERTLVKVLAAGLLLVFRDKRAAICHTYSMSIHKFLYLFQKVLVTCFNKVVSPFVFSLFEQIAGNLLFSTSHEIPYTSRYFKQLASTPLHLYAPLFPSGHPSVTNSRFEVSSRWVDGPMWWLSEDMHHGPWFHHYNSTVTLKKIDVSSTNWWIHSAHRCGVSPVPNIPKSMPLTRFLWNITIW